jgi:hypothetical protein
MSPVKRNTTQFASLAYLLTATKTLCLAPLLALALLAWGCGDEGDSSIASRAMAGPLYAVTSTVFTADMPVSYLTVVNSLAPGAPIDLRNSMEFGGDARAYGPEGRDVVYMTSTEDGTMTEVRIEPDGSLRLGRVVSFGNHGINQTTGGNVHHFMSPSKAYFVSQQTLQIVVWNPAEMTIVTTIPLPQETDAARQSVAFYPRPIVVGDQLVLISSGYDESDIATTATVTVVDTALDLVVDTTTETRCFNMLQSAVDAQGDRYFASGSLGGALHFLFPEQAPAPCLLRMRAGETSFDPDWSRSFTEELGTRLWTGVTPGANGTIYVQSIAEDAPAVVAGSSAADPFEVANAQPWSWHALTGPDAEPTPVEADLFAPPVFAPIPVEETGYISLWDSDNGETTLVDLTSDETPQKALVVPGFVYNIVRIR